MNDFVAFACKKANVETILSPKEENFQAFENNVLLEWATFTVRWLATQQSCHTPLFFSYPLPCDALFYSPLLSLFRFSLS